MSSALPLKLGHLLDAAGTSHLCQKRPFSPKVQDATSQLRISRSNRQGSAARVHGRTGLQNGERWHDETSTARTEPTPEPAKPLGSGTARLDVPDESTSGAAALPEAGTGVVTFPPGAARHVSNFIPLTPLDLAQQSERG
jgi:hypothetical protein